MAQRDAAALKAPLVPKAAAPGSVASPRGPSEDKATLQALDTIALRQTSRRSVLSRVEIVLRTITFLALVAWIIMLIVKKDEHRKVEEALAANPNSTVDEFTVDFLLAWKWILWAIIVFCVVGENRWVLRKECVKRYLRTGTQETQIKELKKEMYVHHLELREAMLDIVDTWLEKVRHAVHHNPLKLKLEGVWSYRRYDKTGDALGALESNIDWASWPAVGKVFRGEQVQFGESMRRLYFDVCSGYMDIMGCGIVPKPVRDARIQWDDANQKNPVLWRFQSLNLRLQEAQSRIASEVQADPDDLVFVASGEEGIATVLRSLPWETGDKLLLITADGGDAFLPTANFLSNQCGVDVLTYHVDIPIPPRLFLRELKVWLRDVERGKDGEVLVGLPKVAVFSHVLPCGWQLPAVELTSLFHRYSISVLIEGTHAIGQYPIHVSDINADWYTASLCHFIPGFPGCGFLVANPLKHECTTPLTVSYFDRKGYFTEFSYYGLRDFSSWLSIIDAYDFVSKVCGGFEATYKYRTQVIAHAHAIIKRELQTVPLQPLEEHGSTVTFEVPNTLGYGAEAAANLKLKLVSEGVTVHVFSAAFRGAKRPSLYVRASAGIHTTPEDFRKLVGLLKTSNARRASALSGAPSTPTYL